MKNSSILTVIISLIVGFGSGYFYFKDTATKKIIEQSYSNVAVHQMPDGSMMNNVGMDMESMMQSMMTGLKGKTGDAFDKEFLSEMIIHHQGAVEMAKAVLLNSKRPELLKLAEDIISAQTKEIDIMQVWQKTWFK